MAVNYTEEQLNNVDKSFLIQLLLQQQEQLNALTKELHASNEKMQLLMEQVILGKQNRFGRSSEKMEDTSQICFREVNGTIVFFNEAEAVCDLNAAEPEDLELKSPKQPKRKGKKESDLSGQTDRPLSVRGGIGSGIRCQGLETVTGCHFQKISFRTCEGRSRRTSHRCVCQQNR